MPPPCTGNLRSAAEAMYRYEHTGDAGQRNKSLMYYCLVVAFMVGALLGAICSKWLHYWAVLVDLVPLAPVLFDYVSGRRQYGVFVSQEAAKINTLQNRNEAVPKGQVRFLFFLLPFAHPSVYQTICAFAHLHICTEKRASNVLPTCIERALNALQASGIGQFRCFIIHKLFCMIINLYLFRLGM